MGSTGIYSENEDDPSVYESSGEEWTESPEFTQIKKKRNCRSSGRTTKKARSISINNNNDDDNTSSSDEDDAQKDVKHKTRNGVNKKQKLEAKTTNITDSRINNTQEYSSGCFLIHKQDAQVGDRTKHPCIWRVDGKALLQKYEPFEDNGQIRHRTTSVYTGWSSLDRDLYAPIKVNVYKQPNHTLVVDVDWEQLRQIHMDSD